MPVYEEIIALVEELRRRVFAAKRLRTTKTLAQEMGMSPLTLRAWLRNESTLRPDTLARVERWCEEQEGKHHAS
jgi:methylphosphotriester-DNA--protein-cysteine methyltransferase